MNKIHKMMLNIYGTIFFTKYYKCLYEHSIAVIKLKVERYGTLVTLQNAKFKEKRGEKENERMFSQQGIEPEWPA